MGDHVTKPPARGFRLGYNHESSEVTPELALEWERLRLERQKYALEVRLKRRESQQKNAKHLWKDLLTNPVTIAIAGGVITLLTAVVTNYLSTSEARRADQAKARLTEQSTRETLQADLIKKFVESPRTETVRENLRFLVDAGLIPSYADSIKKYLDSNPGVAPRVGGGIEFSPSGVSVADDIKGQLQKAVNGFTTYLQNLGFPGLDNNVSVFVYSKDNPPPKSPPEADDINALYKEKVIYVHKKMAESTSAVLHEYTYHALFTALNSSGEPFNEIAYALADYLPASFLDSPTIGAGLGPLVGLKTNFLRTLDSAASYQRSSSSLQRGAIWAAALWACRVRGDRQAVDSLILPAWRQAMGARGDENHVAEEFGKALIAATPSVGSCFSTEVHNRKLP